MTPFSESRAPIGGTLKFEPHKWSPLYCFKRIRTTAKSALSELVLHEYIARTLLQCNTFVWFLMVSDFNVAMRLRSQKFPEGESLDERSCGQSDRRLRDALRLGGLEKWWQV